MSDTSISCAGGCGQKKLDVDDAQASGWEYLPIARRYRCGQCTRELKAAGRSDADQQSAEPSEDRALYSPLTWR